MALLFWDGILRGAAAGQFLLLVLLFLRDGRQSPTAWIGVLLALSGTCYLVLPALPMELEGAWWRVPIHLMSLAGPGLFWLFAASWFDDDFVLRPHHILINLTSIALGAVANYTFLIFDIRLWPVGAAWRVLSAGMVVAGIVVALHGRNNDLIESRRRVRLALSIAIGVVILWIVLAELPLRNWPPPIGWRLINAASLLALGATLTASMLGWRDPTLLAAPAKPLPVSVARLEPDDSALLARLGDEMIRERLYRQDGLTITAVAARLGVPEYRLRRAINQGLGARNFNAYLNGFRLDEAREALADPAQREVPILTIALDAGFGSLAPFNRAFRLAEDCTPSEYRARALIDFAKPTG